MSYPSLKKCVVKQNECNECWKLNRFGFCAFSEFHNSNCYCIKHPPCRCPHIWIIDSIWRFIEEHTTSCDQ
jgi:hypothetical protein